MMTTIMAAKETPMINNFDFEVDERSQSSLLTLAKPFWHIQVLHPLTSVQSSLLMRRRPSESVQ